MAFTQFRTPLNPHSIAKVASHIVEQLHKVEGFIPQALRQKLLVLELGAGNGERAHNIQQALGEEVLVFAVEPEVFITIQEGDYKADINKLFPISIEDLLSYDDIPGIKELEGAFDRIIISNIRILGNIAKFYDAIFKLLKADGMLIIGRSFNDSFHDASHLSHLEYLRARFRHVNFVLMQPPEGIRVDTFLGRDQTVLQETAQMISAHFPQQNCNEQQIQNSLIAYGLSYRQFLWRVDGKIAPELEAERKEAADTSFMLDMKRLSLENFKIRKHLAKNSPRMKMLENSITTFCRLKREQEEALKFAPSSHHSHAPRFMSAPPAAPRPSPGPIAAALPAYGLHRMAPSNVSANYAILEDAVIPEKAENNCCSCFC